MANFSGSFIADTYQRVIQLDTTLQDGTGSLLQDLPVTASHAISASYAVSASVEILKEISSSNADTASLALSGDGHFSGSFTGSFIGTLTGVAATASYVEYTGIANKPTLISSSEQIADDISGSFTSTSASLAASITTNSSSFSVRVTDLETFSSSLDDTFATEVELNTATSSLSSSLAIDIASLITDSGSFSTRVTDLETFSSSLDNTFATEAELNAATASLSSSLAIDISTNSSSIANLTSATSSYSTGSGESISSGSIAFSPTSSGVLGYWNISGSIIPTENEQYDLGNAEYKIRHLFLSDNSIYVGDNHIINAESLDNQLGLSSSLDPILPNSPGSKGDVVTDATHVYICTGPDTWVRANLETAW
jgi:uncharacterized protein (DUF1778 family)